MIIPPSGQKTKVLYTGHPTPFQKMYAYSTETNNSPHFPAPVSKPPQSAHYPPRSTLFTVLKHFNDRRPTIRSAGNVARTGYLKVGTLRSGH